MKTIHLKTALRLLQKKYPQAIMGYTNIRRMGYSGVARKKVMSNVTNGVFVQLASGERNEFETPRAALTHYGIPV